MRNNRETVGCMYNHAEAKKPVAELWLDQSNVGDRIEYPERYRCQSGLCCSEPGISSRTVLEARLSCGRETVRLGRLTARPPR